MFLFKWLDDSRARWAWAFSLLALLATAVQLFSLLAPVSMLICVLVVRPGLMAQRLRVLAAPIAVLAVISSAWIVGCMREVGQVNWIAYQSINSRLWAEVRGPVIGEFYDIVVLITVVLAGVKVATALSSREHRGAVVERVSADRDILALTTGWAVVPTVVLSIASFVHPIYSDRYVSASAAGAALLVAFVFVRVFPGILDSTHGRDRAASSRLPRRIMATLGVTAAYVLVVGYLNSASALQEDLQGAARYVASNARSGDVVALPDHTITSAIDYYLAGDDRRLPLWPQTGVRQQYVEGLDLMLHPPTTGRVPYRVWLVTDGSVPGVVRFERQLKHDEYAPVEEQQFTGVTLLLYESWAGTDRVLP